MLVLLSDHGLLVPYMVFNVEPPPGTSHDFVKPPQTLTKNGERLAPSPSSVQESIPTTASSHQVSSSGATTNPILLSKTLLGETIAPSSAYGRSFSLDKKSVLSSLLPPFSSGGSLPNILTASKPPPPEFLKPQLNVTPLSQGVQMAPLISVTTAVKTPPTQFKQPFLLSSTPISTAPQKVVSSAGPSVTASVTTMPPPTGRVVSSAQTPSMMRAMPTTSSIVMPPPLQKLVSSHAPPTKPSAPSPTLSVTSSIEEENVEKSLIASIEQEVSSLWDAM